jgi:hypothetical protein
MRSIVQTPLRHTFSSWKLSISYLPMSKTEGGTNTLSGETIFLGRFDVDEEGVSPAWRHSFEIARF